LLLSQCAEETIAPEPVGESSGSIQSANPNINDQVNEQTVRLR